MPTDPVQIAPTIQVGDEQPLLIIAGPCVIESAELCITVARRMADICGQLGLPYVFKASFDKANRTSLASFRGPGLEKGLSILASVKSSAAIPVLTDIHEPGQAAPTAAVADILQIPAFLCRQTDLLLAAGKTGKPVTVKKGQFLAPEDMSAVVEKLRSTGNQRILLTERGTSFGYHNLVVDMRSLVIMRGLGVPVVFDCTHAVQLPGGRGATSGGNREFVYPLAKAAVAVGIHALFMEVHPEPDKAKSDASNSLALDDVPKILGKLQQIHDINRQSV